MSRITLRCNGDLKESFREHCDTEGKSMSEALKEHMQDVTGHTPSGRLPDEPQLARAYETIYWAAGGNPVEVDDAEAAVSNKLNVPKSGVRGRFIQPLQERGYLTLRQGIDAVRYRPNVDLEPDVFDAEPEEAKA